MSDQGMPPRSDENNVWAAPSEVTGPPQFDAVPQPYQEGQARRRVTMLAAVVFLTAITYVGFLGWDAHKHVDVATGRAAGPYKTWQVVGCAIVVGVWALVVGWLREPDRGSGAIAATVTVCFMLEAVFGSYNDGLWPIGALMLAVLSFLGARAFAELGYRLRQLR